MIMVVIFILCCICHCYCGRIYRADVKAPNRSQLPYYPIKTSRKCGRSPNWTPCVEKSLADEAFLDCCQNFVHESCWDLCSYETDFITATDNLKKTVLNRGCSLRQMSPLLYCASQNRNNTKCCIELGLSDVTLMGDDRCLRMCDIRANNGIGKLVNEDLACLGNWNVLMYCHQSGLDFN